MFEFKKKTERRGPRKGQSLVEFALVVPVLLAMMFAIAEFGYFGVHKVMMQNATRDWARTEAVYATNDRADLPYFDTNGKPQQGYSYQNYTAPLITSFHDSVTCIRVYEVDTNYAPKVPVHEVDFDKDGNVYAKGDGTCTGAKISGGTGPWPPDQRCAGFPSTNFAVEVHYIHTWVTGFFPVAKSLAQTETVYSQIEPQVYVDPKTGC